MSFYGVLNTIRVFVFRTNNISKEKPNNSFDRLRNFTAKFGEVCIFNRLF